MSNIIHKVKDALSGDKHRDTTTSHSTTHGTTHGSAEGSHGPHSSGLANAADPRVDSDRDGSKTVGNTGRTAGHGEYGSGNTFGSSTGNTLGSSTVGSSGYTGHTGRSEGATGPHSSKVANALDPRVDSDRDGSATIGNTGRTTGRTAGHGEFGSGNTFGSSTGNTLGSSGQYSGYSEGATGPHNSKVANALDPRVDSDRDGSNTIGNTGRTTGRTAGQGEFGSGIGGLGSSSDTYGASGNTGYGAGSTGVTGSHGTSGVGHSAGYAAPGPAPHTAGPHKSDALNKVDPRVDSDLDGSKTVGRDQTYNQ